MRAWRRCVYCGRQAGTKDHVIPRCMLEEPYPPNIPTVYSCRACNEGFSQDEQYFLAVVAHSGSVPSLQRKVEPGGVVNRMLQRRPRLGAHFVEQENVAKGRRSLLILDESRIGKVIRKVAFGLYYLRYKPGTPPALADFLALKPFRNFDEANFIAVMAHTERFRPRRWIHVQTLTLPGQGKVQVFSYMFIRNWVWTDFGKLFCIMRFHETLWAAVGCPHPSQGKTLKQRVRTVDASQAHLPL